MTPTLVVVNAHVRTGDPRRPWATGLAVEGTRLAAIGSAAEIQKLARPATRVVDAQGRTVALPSGTTVGSQVHVIVTDDGDVLIHSVEDLP